MGARLTGPLITLLTDFGLQDSYVGQIKGVIAGICPTAYVIDVTHAVAPQQVEQGAFLLETAVGAFPTGTIHIAVVDPGVGTARRALALRTAVGTFIGPDNGLLSCALPEALRPESLAVIHLPEKIKAVALEPAAGRTPSATFHGRDVFAPAAAKAAAGAELRDLGEPISTMWVFPPFRATPAANGALTGRVVHVDRFGNLITSIRADDLPDGARSVEIAGQRVTRLVRTYGDAVGLVALVGSSGYLEVALVNGSAAAELGAGIGAPVRLDALTA